jgi:hypothetical protein
LWVLRRTVAVALRANGRIQRRRNRLRQVGHALPHWLQELHSLCVSPLLFSAPNTSD